MDLGRQQLAKQGRLQQQEAWMRRQRREKARSQGLRIEDAKKARINGMQKEMEDKIRTITVGEEVLYTLDEKLEGEEGHDEEWDSVWRPRSVGAMD